MEGKSRGSKPTGQDKSPSPSITSQVTLGNSLPSLNLFIYLHVRNSNRCKTGLVLELNEIMY